MSRAGKIIISAFFAAHPSEITHVTAFLTVLFLGFFSRETGQFQST